ncbi:MAG: hypothetical protein IK020_06760 [Clostridiales bacterium]|nr:hypothetical protein [Clostridiales bacterium]
MRSLAKFYNFLAKALLPVMALCLVLFTALSSVSAAFSYKPIVAYVPFSCERAEVSGDVTYEFVIERMDEASPKPDKDVILISGSGKANFEVPIDEPGTYSYKVYEKAGTNSDIVYDSTVYMVTLFVTNTETGDLEYQVILSKEDMVKPTEVKFINQAVKKPEKPDTTPIVKTGDLADTWQGAAWAFLVMGAFLLLLALYNMCFRSHGSTKTDSGRVSHVLSGHGLMQRKSFRRVIGVILVVANLVSSTGMVLAKEADEDLSEDTTVSSSDETTDGFSEDPSEGSSETSAPSEGEPTVLTYDGADYSVTVSYGAETGIPDDAELVVNEVTSSSEYDEYYQQVTDLLDEENVGYVRFFDISLMKDGAECEPVEGTSVSVTITLAETLPEDVCVVHLPDDDDVAVVENETANTDEGTEVSFEAEGFSAYAIVTGPTAVTVGWKKFTTVAELKEWAQKSPAEGLCIGSPGGFYLKNTTGTVSSGRVGIAKTTPARSTPSDTDVLYFFELVPGTEDQFYVYCYAADGTTKQYVYNGGNNSLSFTTDEANKTAFTASGSDGKFTLNNGTWYWNMKNDYFVSASDPSYADNILNIWYHEAPQSDPYLLDGQSYGLMYYVSGLKGKGMMSTSSSGNNLDAQVLAVMQKKDDVKKQLFVPQDSDLPMWKFQWAGDDTYYISTQVDGETKYLDVTSSGVTLVDASSKQALKVVPGTATADVGKIRIMSQDGHTVGYSGNTTEGFVHDGSGSFLNLVSKANLTSEYEKVYNAQKKSVTEITNGQQVIIYTRVWNEGTKSYDFYAIDKDGTLVPCIEDGDMIGWVGETENTLLWDFTDYSAGAATSNHYYELYNEASGKYIAPQINGQILSNNTIGIHLDGRENGSYGTSIKAWDDPNYAFAQLAASADGSTIISKLASVNNGSSDLDEKEEFFFAVIDDVFDDDVLEAVPTVDNNDFGIKMYLVDFSPAKTINTVTTTQIQHDVIGWTPKWDANHAFEQTSGLLETNLQENGYPIATKTNKSLGDLFDPSVPNQNIKRYEVNHLFLESTYDSSGYFFFDSSQNYAHLLDNGNFEVYQELGSYDSGGNKPTLKHGQFFPFNDIAKDQFCTSNPQNMYSVTGQELDPSDPRKYERLHLMQGTANAQFGMELETSFVQTPSGHDDWGHDIIYEFTGDDDFWLYVDDELVIDLGGIHSAISGSVNFCTGEVVVNGAHTTLYDVFSSNYDKRGLSQAEKEQKLADIFEFDSANNTYTFKDYTFHTMKVFYMERGGGASNLRMRFNQASVKPETVLFGKEIEGTQAMAASNTEFAFQIYYAYDADAPLSEYERLDPELNDKIKVTYRGTSTDVPYAAVYCPDPNYPSDTYPDDSYKNVFFLKAGELCEISMPDNAIMYYVKECGVDPAIYSSVKVNGKTTDVTKIEHRGTTGLNDYTIPQMPVKQRTKVTFTNVVRADATQTLSFTKWLYDETQLNLLPNDQTTFDFRLYLDLKNEVSTLNYETMSNPKYLAYMQEYNVRDENGNYCKWNVSEGRFVKLGDGKDNYSALTPEEKALCTFQTSANGGISRIPAFYTIEVRGLMPGTKYMIEERDKDMPDGYGRVAYLINENASQAFPALSHEPDWTDKTTAKAVWGQTASGKNPHVDIKNVKGYGIRANKIWVDDAYMADRDVTYFAVYTDGTNGLELVADSVKVLPFGEDTIYWFFETLPNSQTDLENCHVYEVTLSNANPTVNADTGLVTDYGTVTRIADHGEMTLQGRIKGETTASPCCYTVSYAEGQLAAGERVRTDTVTNDRYGIDINKYKWDQTTVLAGAEFILEDSTDSSIVFGPFTSDATGHVTTAFLRKNTPYKLIETKAPEGYLGLESPVMITLGNDGTTLTVDGPTGCYTYTNGNTSGSTPVKPVVNVMNKTYQFQIVKNGNMGEPLDGVVFSLRKWKTVGGVSQPDAAPLGGYDHLVSDANGIVHMPNNSTSDWYTLPAGQYALVEEDNPHSEYELLAYPVRFTVLENGGIRIDGVYEDGEVSLPRPEETNGNVRYTMTVVNKLKATLKITKNVEGNFGSKTQKFTFSVALYDELNQPVYAKLKARYSYSNKDTTISFNKNGMANISLAHGEYLEIKGLNQGYRYVITETKANGYSVKCCEGQTNYDAGTFISGNSIQGRVGENTEVFFVNTKKGILPTGVDFSARAILGAALLLVVGAGATMYMGKRRKETEDDEEDLTNE